MTTSYPRYPGDLAGHFVEKLAQHLTTDHGIVVRVLAPAGEQGSTAEQSGLLRVRRLNYFWPRRLQRLTQGQGGIPWNLRQSRWAWANVPSFLATFAWRICQEAAGVDVIHAHWGVPGALAVLTRPIHRRPVVVTILGSDLVTDSSAIRWLTHCAIRRSEAVIALSQGFAQRINRMRHRDCVVIGLGVEAPAEDALRRHRGGRRARRVVSVGRLIPERRHDLLIRAFARLKSVAPQVHLTLVGGGPQQEPLGKLIRQLGLEGAVQLTGNVATEQVPQYLLAADCYVSATVADAFGTAVVEAAAYGLPIVTTRVGLPGELVVEGRGGYLVDPDNEDQLYAAMTKVVAHPNTQEFGRFNRQRVEHLGLTRSECARRLAELYRTVLEGGQRGNQL